jgi:HemY protein
MQGLVWFLVVAAVAVGLGLLARASEGYLLIVAPPYRIELSLALTVIALVALFAILYWVLRLIVHTLRLPAYVASFRSKQRLEQAQVALRGAWQAYLEGRYGKAQKLAARAFDLGEAPGLAALLAARSAHYLRDGERRDLWLSRAEGVSDDSRHARLATHAELLLDERRFEEARGVLRELYDSGPKHVATLRMLLRAEQGLQNWDEVLRLVNQLQKRGAMPAEAAHQLTVLATVENLKKKSLDATQMRHFWRAVDIEDKAEPRVALTAARLFMRLGDCRTAHAIIGDSLDQQWNDDLVRLYSECTDADSLERLQHAERWLVIHPDDAALLLTLGRLCLQQEIWGKAQSYLEASLAAQPTQAAHLELARLFDRLERADDADRHYRAASDPGVLA